MKESFSFWCSLQNSRKCSSIWKAIGCKRLHRLKFLHSKKPFSDPHARTSTSIKISGIPDSLMIFPIPLNRHICMWNTPNKANMLSNLGCSVICIFMVLLRTSRSYATIPYGCLHSYAHFWVKQRVFTSLLYELNLKLQNQQHYFVQQNALTLIKPSANLDALSHSLTNVWSR